MNFGMRGHDFEASSLEELASKCYENNIKNVQLVFKKTIPDFKEGEFSPEYAVKMRNILDEKGVKVSVLGCYINPSDTNPETLKASMDYFKECLHYAKYMNADVVGLETGFVGDSCDPEKNNSEEAYQYLLKNMRELLSVAEEIDVKIGIEGVWCFVINSPSRMKRLVDDLNSENIRVIFDPVNYLSDTNYENQSSMIDEFFELLGDRVCAIHLKDFAIENGKKIFTNPCQGELDHKRLFEYVKKVNPNLPIILEETTEKQLQKVKESCQNVFNMA